jgi:hypothetical protein
MSCVTDDPRLLDEHAFGARVEPRRRERHVHCYRLPGLAHARGRPLLDVADARRMDRPKRGRVRCVVIRANGQRAVAGYVRKPGDAAYEPLAIDVLRVQDGVVTFDGAVFEHFDLPARLSAAVGTR